MTVSNTNARDFETVKAAFDSVEGMMSLPSARLFHMFLAQQTVATKGHILEIGTYKGKSAIVLAQHLNAGERLDLVDINPYLERERFAAFESQLHFYLANSDDLAETLPDYESRRGTYRFIHSDASHTFANVVNDIKHADILLHPQGVLVMDDYENANYPQVALAVGHALYRGNADLSPLLISNNKMYLCRPAERANMLSLVVNVIAPALYKD